MTLVIALVLVSCNKFLEFEPYGQPSDLSSLSDAQAMQTIYALYEWQYREGTTGRGFFWYENASDDMVTGRTQAEADNIKNFVDNGSMTRDVRDNWPRMYQTINYANRIIDQISDATEISETTREVVMGNAYFWRAFSYLWLAPWYGDDGPNGGIPIVTEATPVEEIDAPRPASVLDNYRMIIDDLENASAYLPYFSDMPTSDWGLVHKTAAWGLAARAALYAAQYDPSFYDVAIMYADRVIDSQHHNLLNSYADVFEIENNWSAEYILSVTSNEVNGSKWPGIGFQNGGFGYYNTWGYFQPTLELYQAFEEGDERRAATILAPGEHVSFIGNDIVWQVNPASTSSPTGLTLRKYLAPFRDADAIGKTVNANGNNMTTDLNVPLMRYAEILLIKAEALIWKNGEGDPVAKKLIDDVRERAGLARDSDATKAQLKNERRVEFAFEWGVWRHLDLVRWGDAQAAYAKPLHGLKVNLANSEIASLEEIEVWPGRQFNPSVHHVFPIPVREISTSENLKQNNGY